MKDHLLLHSMSFRITLILILIISLFLAPSYLLAQSCLPSGITFTTQQQIDDFATDYAGCTEVLGDVRIQGAFSTSIFNLNGLSQIEQIGGSLRFFDNNNLTSLNGLHNLVSVGAFVQIRNQGGLIDLSGLDNLETIASYITIHFNDNLTSLNGLGSLHTIGDDLALQANHSLISLDGLNNLTTIQDQLTIFTHDALTSLDGMPLLTTLGGGLTILQATVLSDISSLSDLTSMGGTLSITDCPAINNLQGLENISSINGDVIFNNTGFSDLDELTNLSSINGRLILFNNSTLSDIYGLENIDPTTINAASSSADDIFIKDNSLLSACAITSICEALELPTTSTNISDNQTGCNSESEIEIVCAALPVVWVHQPKVRIKGKHNEITWTVANQVNNEMFEIEFRSESGFFIKLDELKGHGTFLPEKKYSFIHENPTVGLNYYRIKQVDYDSNFSYSDIVSHRTNNSSILTIYPNPSSDGVFYVEVLEETSYLLHSLNNGILKSGILKKGMNSLKFFELKAGIYVLRTNFGVLRLVRI